MTLSVTAANHGLTGGSKAPFFLRACGATYQALRSGFFLYCYASLVTLLILPLSRLHLQIPHRLHPLLRWLHLHPLCRYTPYVDYYIFHLSHWEQTTTDEVDQERERRLTSEGEGDTCVG